MSVVYFIGCPDASAVKVGWARDAQKRLREHQTGCPLPLTLLATFPGAAKAESRLHRALIGSRIQGEWFDSDHVAKFLEAVRIYGFESAVAGYEITASRYRALVGLAAKGLLASGPDWLSAAKAHWNAHGQINEFVANNVGAELAAMRAAEFNYEYSKARDPNSENGPEIGPVERERLRLVASRMGPKAQAVAA